MEIKPLQVGEPHLHIKFVANFKLTRYSPNKTVMTEEAIKLLNDNYRLKASSFEYLKAKTIGVIVGGVLPFAVSAVFGIDTNPVIANNISSAAHSSVQIKANAATLKQSLPIFQAILEKQGIEHNRCEEITFQLEKAIVRILEGK